MALNFAAKNSGSINYRRTDVNLRGTDDYLGIVEKIFWSILPCSKALCVAKGLGGNVHLVKEKR